MYNQFYARVSNQHNYEMEFYTPEYDDMILILASLIANDTRHKWMIEEIGDSDGTPLIVECVMHDVEEEIGQSYVRSCDV